MLMCVSEAVEAAEHGVMHEDRKLLRDETKQTAKEIEIGEREETKWAEARHKPDEDEDKKA